jgi:hypothetical protein
MRRFLGASVLALAVLAVVPRGVEGFARFAAPYNPSAAYLQQIYHQRLLYLQAQLHAQLRAQHRAQALAARRAEEHRLRQRWLAEQHRLDRARLARLAAKPAPVPVKLPGVKPARPAEVKPEAKKPDAPRRHHDLRPGSARERLVRLGLDPDRPALAFRAPARRPTAHPRRHSPRGNPAPLWAPPLTPEQDDFGDEPDDFDPVSPPADEEDEDAAGLLGDLLGDRPANAPVQVLEMVGAPGALLVPELARAAGNPLAIRRAGRPRALGWRPAALVGPRHRAKVPHRRPAPGSWTRRLLR